MYPIHFQTFLIAFSFIFALFLIQILIWRILKPQKQIAVLFILFLGLPLLLLAMTFLVEPLNIYLPALVLSLALGVVYVQSFPGIQAISPSLEMISAVQKKMSTGGATLQDIHQAVLSERILNDRLQDLVRDGMAEQGPDGLRLKFSGRLLAKTFFYYRKALGLPRGEG